MSGSVRDYYERNTRLFLALGGGGRTQSIHRAVWGPGVRTRAAALEYSNTLLAGQIPTPPAPRFALDLGCGVGGSLFSLAARLPDLHGAGVTLSPLQVAIARRSAARLNFERRLTFLEADFTRLPPLPPAGLAFSIEAFVLCPDPGGYFHSAAGALAPGGRLAVIDDFLAPGADPHGPLPNAFRAGWHAAGLNTPAAADACARRAGFRLLEDRDLTPWLRRGPRDRLVSLAVRLGQVLRLRGEYWNSLAGGDALSRGLDGGVFTYRMLIWEI